MARKSTSDKQRRNSGERRKPSAKEIANLRPFKPGQSGNPKGRPKAVLLSDAYRRKLSEVNPDDPERRTWAECIAAAQVESAARGRVIAAQEIADRTEGKPQQSISVTITDMIKRAREDHGIDIASDPVLSALFAAASSDADGGGADTAAGQAAEE